MINLTFLQAKVGRLAKTVTPAGVEPYPNAAQFISHHETVADIHSFAQTLRDQAAKGHCLHVGDLSTPLRDWGRRAGLAVKNSALRWCVLDIDGIPVDRPTTVFHGDHLANVAADVLEMLELPVLSQTSCIVQASSKMGLHERTVSMHVFYLIDRAVQSHQLKTWLKTLNMESPYLANSITLNATGFSLRWPLDISAADTGRLIYIAPPTFQSGAFNPFGDDDDTRIAVLERDEPMIASRIITSASVNATRETRLKNALRDLAGLPREKAKIRTITLNGERHELLLNPARATLRFHHEARGFNYYNLNDGDSAAYYHPEGKPDIIFNFKGEPAFRWEDVDPEGYSAYCEANAELIAKVNPINTFIVVNRDDDSLYKVWHHREENKVTIIRTSRPQVEDFYAEYGMMTPEYLQTWTIDSIPEQDFVIDYTGKVINTFVPSEYLRAGQLRDYDRDVTAEDPTLIRELCPNIWFLLHHIVGNGTRELHHLLNWLAVIVQKRVKTGSAFIFQGVEGSGKGTLYETILQPLFGRANVDIKTNNALADQFNGWRRGKLVVCFDEFEVPNTATGRKQLAELREWITNPLSPIREMHRTSHNYRVHDNFVFFTNQYNMLPIPEKERRYTICPRQDVNLAELCSTTVLRQNIAQELPEFASLLHALECDIELARLCLNNEAKATARKAAATIAEEFMNALKTGNLDFMLNIFESIDSVSSQNILDLDAARRTVIEMIRSRQSPKNFSIGELTRLYNVMFDQKMTAFGFGKMLSRMGLADVRFYDDNRQRKRGYQVQMTQTQLQESELNELLARNQAHLQVVNG